MKTIFQTNFTPCLLVNSKNYCSALSVSAQALTLLTIQMNLNGLKSSVTLHNEWSTMSCNGAVDSGVNFDGMFILLFTHPETVACLKTPWGHLGWIQLTMAFYGYGSR